MSRVIPYCKKQDQRFYSSTSNGGPALSALSSLVASGIVGSTRPGEKEASDDTLALAGFGGLFWMAAGLVSSFMVTYDCIEVDDQEYQRLKEAGKSVYEPDPAPPDAKNYRVASGLMLGSLVYNLGISAMATTDRNRRAIQSLAIIPLGFLSYDYFFRDEFGRKKSSLAYWGIEPTAKMLVLGFSY